jgi:xanthine dehydrogenase accessory factor
MKNIYLQSLDSESDNFPVLATVARSEGSTPQKPGSSAIFNQKGLLSGTVGGGVVEGRIQNISIESFFSKNSGYFQFNLENDISRKEEAICGGRISILVDANTGKHRNTFNQLKESIYQNFPGVLITTVRVNNLNEAEIDRYWTNGQTGAGIPIALWKRIENDINDLISGADPTEFRDLDLTETGSKDSLLVLLEPVFPPLNLVIAGAGHIGRALAHLGRLLEFEVTVIDDRAEYANKENIPDATRLIIGDIGEAVNSLRKGPDTYLVIVTRGHKDDAAALRAAIDSRLAYTGMIGSRKKLDAMRLEFIREGWATPEQWSALYSPIGLEINSQTIEEIAVSIAAQIIQVKNCKTGKKRGCPS